MTKEPKDKVTPATGAPATEYERTAREADAAAAKRKAEREAEGAQPETPIPARTKAPSTKDEP